MTGPPGGVSELISSGPPRQRRPRPRTRAALTEAIATGAAVAAGIAGAMTLLPDAPTPRGVAETFVAAGIDQDWARAWALLCSADQATVSYQEFAARADRRVGGDGRPADVDLTVGATRGPRGPAEPRFTVSMTITFDERTGNRVLDSDIPLIAEGGTLRVCFTALARGT